MDARFEVHIDSADLAAMKANARAMGFSLSDWVRVALRAALHNGQGLQEAAPIRTTEPKSEPAIKRKEAGAPKERMVRCPVCRGTRGAFDETSQEWKDCPRCGGRGKVQAGG